MMTTVDRRVYLLTTLVGCAKPVSLPSPASLDPSRTGVSEPAPIPPLDDRAYRIVKLDNGLTAMLVSDPDATESAAALSVSVGSFAEPDARPGLAHFLEHMLFMGTDVYPDVDDFNDYLATHAGDSNAWTDDEATMYHFTVDAGAFDQALHRFSRFFIGPLLKKRYVQQERKSVESEYRMNQEDDETRWMEARRETVNPDHPGSRFSWGSMQTLADRPGDRVMDDLRVFYDKYYTADRMQLAVVGREPIDTLEGWARGWFSQVPAGPGAALPGPQPQFQDDQLGVRIDIQQLEDVHSLVLEWPIPEQRSYWPDDPTSLLVNVLGDEGPGSLYSQLSERDWVTSLTASTSQSISPDGDLFQIDMTLTSEGAVHTDDIVTACFAAIETLKTTPIPAHLAQENRALKEIGFRFEAPMDAGPLSRWLAQVMIEYPPEDAMHVNVTNPVDDPKVLARFLDQMSIERVRIITAGKDVDTDQTEPMFNVGYRMRSLTDTERLAYRSASEIVVTLPPANPWIPSTTEVGTTEVADPARRIDSDGSVWVAPDARWKTPRTIAQFDLHMSPDGITELKDKVLAVIYDRLLYQHLNDFRYPIAMAKSYYKVNIGSLRFQLLMNSWSDIHTTLVDAILTEVRAFEPTSRGFENQKAERLRVWGNHVHNGPIAQISKGAKDAIYPDHWSTQEWIEALEALEFEDLQLFVQDYWRPGRARVLSFGDTTDADTLTARDHLLRHAAVEPAEVVSNHGQVRWYPQGISRTHEVAVDHDDSAVWMMYLGPPGIPAHARWSVLSELLEQPFFNELRTRQQLGYAVDLWGSFSLRVPGIRLEMQSSVAGPTVLLDRVETFLQDSPALLESMDAQAFATARDGLAELYREPASTFIEQWSRIHKSFFWSDTDGNYDDRLADAIQAVSQEDVVELARELFATDSPTRIVAWTVGRAHADDPLKATADCADRACLAEGMQVVFTHVGSPP